MYRLNIYSPVMLLDDGETYVFYEPSGIKNQNKTIKMSFQAEQKVLLNILFNKGTLNEDELYFLFGKENTIQLISCGIITEKEIENDIASRSRAFYEQYGLSGAVEKLSHKKVLILGCGGIGTYVSWQIAAMGVKKIKLVDFDYVEASNLNRQILYTKEDIGRLKAEVLKQRISQISYDTQIEYEITKIACKDDLEKLCIEEDYDLIVKALDSPTRFPLWLDQICKERKLSYVTGLTFKNETMIGPTFIGGKSKVGWSDLIDVETFGDKVFGTVSSVGIALSHISSEISFEAFKVLTGEGELNYENKIVIDNFLTNDSRYITKKKNISKEVLDNVYVKVTTELFIMVLLAFLSDKNILMFLFSFIVGFFAPSVTFKNRKTAFKMACLNSMVLQIVILLQNAKTIIQFFSSFDSVQILLITLVGIFVIISVFSIASCFFANLIRRKK